MNNSALLQIKTVYDFVRNEYRYWAALAIVAFVQTAVLGWMIYDRVSILNSGREIVLSITLRDPRSLFRGDYVRLNYDILSLDSRKLDGDDKFKKGSSIYVALKRDEKDQWQPVSLHKSMPHPLPDSQVVMRGKVFYGHYRVKYGIETYFVPENEGKRLEKVISSNKMSVLVAVGKDGEAAIKGLITDGKLQYEEPLF